MMSNDDNVAKMKKSVDFSTESLQKALISNSSHIFMSSSRASTGKRKSENCKNNILLENLSVF